MNPAIVLALIIDMYSQLQAVIEKNQQLSAELAEARSAKEESS